MSIISFTKLLLGILYINRFSLQNGDQRIKDVQGYLKMCCSNGLEEARSQKYYDGITYITESKRSASRIWLNMCEATFQICFNNEMEKQNCEAGRLAALKSTGRKQRQNVIYSLAYLNCLRACEIGLLMSALEINCTHTNLYSLAEVSSFTSCCLLKRSNGLSNRSNIIGSSSLKSVALISGQDNICNKTYDSLRLRTCERNVMGTSNKSHSLSSIKKSYTLTYNVTQICSRDLEFVNLNQKCEDINECALQTHNCTIHEYCRNTEGSYECVPNRSSVCQDGYRFNEKTYKCEVYNECKNNPCAIPEKCLNYDGVFLCQSSFDYQYPHNTIENNSRNNCQTGFEFNDTKCNDVDECSRRYDTCDSYQNCINDIGGYHCVCKTGFHFDEMTTSCKDINECSLHFHKCLPTQRCDNTLGSYVCTRLQSCGTGYTLNAETSNCDDDDECALNTHNCPDGFACHNTKGSFRCFRKNTPLKMEMGTFGFRSGYPKMLSTGKEVRRISAYN